MFNLQGSEIIVILLLALVVLGPEKLPDAIRKFAQTYAELKKMGTGFQSELRSALDEPMREMRETATLVQNAANPDIFARTTPRETPVVTEPARNGDSEPDDAAVDSSDVVDENVAAAVDSHTEPTSSVDRNSGEPDQVDSEPVAKPVESVRPSGPAFHSAAPKRTPEPDTDRAEADTERAEADADRAEEATAQ